MALFPAWAQLHTINDVAAARAHFAVGDDVWDAWIANVGDPGTDLRLLAALPRSAVVGGCQAAVTAAGNGFTAIQATQVGLLWRLARRVLAFRAGLSADEFQDEDPWEAKGGSNSTGGTVAPVQATVKDKVLKMSALVDQADESELLPPTSDEVDGWLPELRQCDGGPTRRGGRAHSCPISSIEEEDTSRRCAIHGLWSVATLRTESNQEPEVQNVCAVGRWVLSPKGVTRTG